MAHDGLVASLLYDGDLLTASDADLREGIRRRRDCAYNPQYRDAGGERNWE
jgi:hypothetical protein